MSAEAMAAFQPLIGFSAIAYAVVMVIGLAGGYRWGWVMLWIAIGAVLLGILASIVLPIVAFFQAGAPW